MSKALRISLMILLVAMLIAGAFLGGMAVGYARGTEELDAKVDYYEKDRARTGKILRDAVEEIMELRQRLGLPQWGPLGDQ